MNVITKFFHACSGAHPTILHRAPTESSKYVGIGATILFTGLYASLAAAYALFTVFDNYYAAILGGLLWGGMIFNLDRYIVSSMKKKDNWKAEFKMATPRILLAVIIALVISKPLELKIFEKEIDSELVIMQQEVRKQQEDEVKARFEEQLTTLYNESDLLKAEIKEKIVTRDNLRDMARQEADGTGGTGIKNPGPIYRIKKENADRVERELQELTTKNNDIIREKLKSIDSIQQFVAREILAVQQTSINGLAGRLHAMDNVSQKNSAIMFAHWFIIILFIAIECAPIFVKLISERGPYDYLLNAHEHRYHTHHAWDVGHINESIKRKSGEIGMPEKEWIIDEITKPLRIPPVTPSSETSSNK